MSKEICAFRLKRCTMGGAEWQHVAFVSRPVAVMAAQERNEEFVNYEVHSVLVRPLTDTEGAVGHDVVTIDRTTEDEALRARALRKLTEAEKKALGL